MMRDYRKRFCAVALAALALCLSTPRAQAVDDAGTAYFETHIRPLLAKRCYRCHSTQTGKRKGGLVLDGRSGWTAGGARGPAIVPGDEAASPLIRAVRYTDPDLQMPPGKALAKEEIARLEQWVRMGAPAPLDAVAGDEREVFEDPSDPIAGRNHWAYRPLARQRPPAVNDAEWPRTAIDRFVLLRLEAAGLRPAADASDRDLVRRVFFQLTGLPPTPQQVDAYLADERPGRFEWLVDRLLNSPAFGQRWGRHWLDLARYADSNGLDENFLFREAWRYRNWVIDAVNDDLPFDRFILEQIAGDLLPAESIEQRDRQRIAAGFLVVGPKVLLGNKDERQRMEIADEQIDTIGRAILGQTLGCARCHDHKFDPIPTADYYALAGILTSTQVMERRHMFNQQRVMERLVGIGPGGQNKDSDYEEYWVDRDAVKKKIDRAKSALAMIKRGDEQTLKSLREKASDVVAETAADSTQTTEQRLEAQKALIAELDAKIGKAPDIPPRAMVPTDADTPADEHIRLAGEFDSLGEEVPRGFLQAVCTNPVPEIPDGQSGRMELARWLTDVDNGAGPLAARVLANRIWHHLFGQGLVRTVDNFGRTGEAPSHPELLDYLAQELIDSGWSIKAMVRRIVLSRTNAMCSTFDAAASAIDPENRLHWRFSRRRLDPEALRDSMLTAAGQLDRAPMDSTVWYLADQATSVGNVPRRRTDFSCRSVYLPVIRNDLPEIFDVFDFADPHFTTGRRPDTTVAMQGLYMLNAEMVMDAAQAVARRLLDDDTLSDPQQRVQQMFELILNTPPTADDAQRVRAFVEAMDRQLAAGGEEQPDLRAWAMACHALFASSRFQYLE